MSVATVMGTAINGHEPKKDKKRLKIKKKFYL